MDNTTTERFGLLRAFYVLVSFYNVFNITGLLAFLGHYVSRLLGDDQFLLALPYVLGSFIALLVHSVFLCRFKPTARKAQLVISAIAPFVRAWAAFAVLQSQPERFSSVLWAMLVVAVMFDVLVVLVTKSQKARRATNV